MAGAMTRSVGNATAADRAASGHPFWYTGVVETWREFEQNVITHSAAHHLMAIDDLMQRRGYARVSDIARELGITRGSVSISLAPHIKNGLITQDENKHLRLTERGQELVDAIKTKRLVVQRLFAEVLGVEPVQAEIDACKLEHLVSNATALRLVSFLRFLDSHDKRAEQFLNAWRAFEDACGHDPARCPSCTQSGCLAESVTPVPLRGR